MIIILTANNYFIDENAVESKDNIYVDDTAFQSILSDKEVRDSLLRELNVVSLAIGRVGKSIQGNLAFARKDIEFKNEDILKRNNLEKEFGYYARL